MDDRGGERIEAILDVRRARTKRARMRNYTYMHTPVIRVASREGRLCVGGVIFWNNAVGVRA